MGCAHAACGCAQLCRRCLATQKGTHRPQWGHRVEGCMEGSIPARCLHSPGVPCICACPRTPRLCPCCVCEGHTRVHTCALSACVLCHQIPLPVQATCLPPSPCAGLVPGSSPGCDHPVGSEPQGVCTQAGGPRSANPSHDGLVHTQAAGNTGMPNLGPTPWEGQEGAPWQGRLPGLGKGGWEPGSIPPPHPVHTPRSRLLQSACGSQPSRGCAPSSLVPASSTKVTVNTRVNKRHGGRGGRG